MSDTTPPPAAAVAQESYIVSEGKKRGSTRDVRAEAVHDRYYTVLRVHAGDAILTDNWHTTEVLGHARNNFEGYTFAMRTLEAWGAQIESDQRAYYTAGGRVWVMDLEPSAGKKRRLPGTGSPPRGESVRGGDPGSPPHRASVRGGDPGSGKK